VNAMIVQLPERVCLHAVLAICAMQTVECIGNKDSGSRIYQQHEAGAHVFDRRRAMIGL
jgi:hypothetical protein